ncbi:hypothetical protein SEA_PHILLYPHILLY_112 [Microbacterium phage PhillyPhilly]|nr:hypothetical protein SEA_PHILLYPHILLY_2 [Microbacterium phage PhillyPhilly]QDH92261.1 hypothetical protein SEA_PHILLYPHILLY_112 [Microbacterium phage PhillyPhilly]
MSLTGVVRYRQSADEPWIETGYGMTTMSRLISAGYEYELEGRDYGVPAPILPPNTDDLTLWTDPVTQWALRALAAWAGAVVCVAISLIP